MAHLISWVYCYRKSCFILKRTDGKKMLIEKIKGVMRLDEDMLLEAYKQDTPLGNCCDQSDALMRVLREKFEPKEPEMHEQVAGWTFLETGRVKVVWMNGAARWYPTSVLLSSTDFKLLEQLAHMRPKKPKPSAFLSQFEMDIMLRVEELKAAGYGGQREEDESDDGFYEEEDMTEEDYYG